MNLMFPHVNFFFFVLDECIISLLHIVVDSSKLVISE
jgi:hypothetical protein